MVEAAEDLYELGKLVMLRGWRGTVRLERDRHFLVRFECCHGLEASKESFRESWIEPWYLERLRVQDLGDLPPWLWMHEPAKGSMAIAWMFNDTALGLARDNPLRWSQRLSLIQVIEELKQQGAVARPVRLSITCLTGSQELPVGPLSETIAMLEKFAASESCNLTLDQLAMSSPAKGVDTCWIDSTLGEATVEGTVKATGKATAEETTEATAEASAEATVDATIEATVETTVEAMHPGGGGAACSDRTLSSTPLLSGVPRSLGLANGGPAEWSSSLRPLRSSQSELLPCGTLNSVASIPPEQMVWTQLRASRFDVSSIHIATSAMLHHAAISS